MHVLLRLFLVAIALFAGAPAFADSPCRTVVHLAQEYTVCSFDPKRAGMRLFHSNAAGTPYLTFRTLVEDIENGRHHLRFAMNAGMYHDDMSPVGLYVENRIERKAISTKAGWGNFHLLPNGVFYLDSGKAGVMETSAYVAAGLKPWYATQSGPMLVINGRIHPKFLATSDSFKTRNGVGIGKDGKVYAAVSEEEVRFHDFATLFRDALGCDNALFLDCTISGLYVPEKNRDDDRYPMGPIFAVVETHPG